MKLLILFGILFSGAIGAEFSLEEIRQEFNHLQAEIIALRSDVSTLKKENEMLKEQLLPDTNPGFTAYADAVQEVVADDVLVFGGVVTNFNNDYNPSNGIFTCSYTGTYFFSVSVRSDENVLDVALMINNNPVIGIRVRDMYHSESNSLVTECNAGDTVHVGATGPGAVYGADTTADLRVSSFSGYLVRLYV